MYAVVTGTYVGELWAYTTLVGNAYHFLSMPKMVTREIQEENFEYAMNNNIIEFVEQLPRNVYKVVEAQYKQIQDNG